MGDTSDVFYKYKVKNGKLVFIEIYYAVRSVL